VATGTPATALLAKAKVAYTLHPYEHDARAEAYGDEAAAALGGKKAELADPAAATRATGYVVGGISPLGQKSRLRVLVDSSAEALDTVYVSAGRRGLQVQLAPADLVRLAGARVAAISTAS
jgi:Cys-tRNA(Pro)/Cys-tRNA(Cys) deacylase